MPAPRHPATPRVAGNQAHPKPPYRPMGGNTPKPMPPNRHGPASTPHASTSGCHHCGRPGHFKANCPQLQHQRRVAVARVDEEPEEGEHDAPPDEEALDQPLQDEESADPSYEEYPTDMPVEWHSEDNSPDWGEGEEHDTQHEYRANMMLVKHHEPEIHKRVFMTKYQHTSATTQDAPKASNTQPVYDHRLRPKNQPRPPEPGSKARTLDGFWEIGGVKAHCLLDSGCEGIIMSPNFARASRLKTFPLDRPVNLQLAVVGSRSVANYGAKGPVKFGRFSSTESFDIANIDYYDVILGTPFLRKWGVSLDFSGQGNILIGKETIPTNKGQATKPTPNRSPQKGSAPSSE